MKKKDKILIIGNQGYVGSVLVKFLKKNNTSVYGLDSGIFSKILIDKNPDKLLSKQLRIDIKKINSSLLNKFETIIYLAAISNDPMGNKFHNLTLETNYNLCLKIAKMAKKQGVKKFIFASSCSVYGSVGKKSRKENDKLDPKTIYAKTKIWSEKKLKNISNKNFKVFCLRFATACGYSPRIRLDLVLNDFITSAIVNKNITLLSDGKAWRPLISVDNMSRIISYFTFKKLTSLKKNFYIINCGTNNWNFRIISLAKTVSSLIKKTPVIIGNANENDKRSYKVNFNYLKKLAPDLNLDENIDKLILQMYNKIKKVKIDRDFRQSKFIRLVILEKYLKKYGN